MRKSVINSWLVAAIVLLVAIALYVGRQQGADGADSFVGSDSRAVTRIETANPDYAAWVEPVFEPAAGEIESGLFALQAGLGAGVLGFVLGALWQRSRTGPV